MKSPKGEPSKYAGYRCPMCGKRTQVVDSRWIPTQFKLRRRRECPIGHRFTTYEDVETVDYQI